MSIYVDNIEFVLVECCECYTPMMMTAHMKRRLQRTKGTFYCIACKQSQGWYGDTKEEKERKRLEAQLKERESALSSERRMRAMAEDQERFAKNQVRAQKAAKTKLKKRIHNGVCPCCTRSFADLRRHMATKHPDYAVDGKEAEVITFKVLREKLELTQQQIAEECNTKAAYVSLYERDKPCPADARASIEKWFDQKREAKA